MTKFGWTICTGVSLNPNTGGTIPQWFTPMPKIVYWLCSSASQLTVMWLLPTFGPFYYGNSHVSWAFCYSSLTCVSIQQIPFSINYRIGSTVSCPVGFRTFCWPSEVSEIFDNLLGMFFRLFTFFVLFLCRTGDTCKPAKYHLLSEKIALLRIVLYRSWHANIPNLPHSYSI